MPKTHLLQRKINILLKSEYNKIKAVKKSIMVGIQIINVYRQFIGTFYLKG